MIDRGDVLFAVRSWRRSPGVVAIAALSLALGIGATTTMFSVVNSISQYELEFEDADRLVVLWHRNAEQGFARQPPTWESVAALREHGAAFESIGFFQGGGAPVTLVGDEGASRVSQQPIDVEIFRVLRTRPSMGRLYEPEDLDDLILEKEVRPIVISHETWQERFDADPGVIGRTIRVDAEPRPVIGVMPEGFSIVPWVDDTAFWAANDLGRVPRARWMIAVGRLAPGVTPEQAEAEATRITRRVLESRGEPSDPWSAQVIGLHEAYFGDLQAGLTFLLGAVSFVLLIACANVANLLLATGRARARELATRAAVGASRARLARQLLTESVLLALLGGAAGVLFAFWGNRIYATLVPAGFPDFARDVYVDHRVLAFTLAVSLATGLLFGLLPALRSSRVELGDVLKDGGRGAAGSRGRGRSALLVAEVALSMVLLVGAGLMMRGFLKEQSELPGFETQGLLTADVLLSGEAYFQKIPGDKNRVTPLCASFYERLLEEVRALPGVRHASVISRLPLQVWSHPFTIVGAPPPEPGRQPVADLNEIDGDLFRTLGIPLLRGRAFDDGDVESSAWVAVVNETFAERHFPDGDAIGRAIRLTLGGGGSGLRMEEPRPREIVGVVADVEYPSFYPEPPAALYIPYRQHLEVYAGGDQWMHTRKTLVLRTELDPLSFVAPVQRIVERIDPDQAAHDFMTMDQRVANAPSVSNRRFLARLFGIFGALAILLAMVGVYGVMSHFVGQRTNEFGIRLALGARSSELILMLLRQSLRPVLVGVTLGFAGGLALSQVLSSVFFRLTAADPVAFGGVTALMVAAALLAAWVPARRVTRIDPQRALRYE